MPPPKEEVNESEHEQEPLLFVDVNLGTSEPQRIVIYEGDTAEELANKFQIKHGIDDDMKSKLVNLLKQ